MQSTIAYRKPGKTRRVFEFFRGVFSVVFFTRTAQLFAYYVINYINGFRICRKGVGVNIHPTVILRHPHNIEVGDRVFLNHNNILQGGIENAKIRIGARVMTGPNVMMFAYNHGTNLDAVAMIDQPYSEDDIEIGEDVWIGAGSIILAGSRIGRGAVIAAGSVVRGRIAPNTICGGVPARYLKDRVEVKNDDHESKFASS